MFITFRSRFPFLKSGRWRRKFFAMGPYIPWILRPPCVSMDQKLEEVGKRYSRNDFIPQESSWPITREEKNVVRPWIVENHPKSGAIPFLFLFFLSSLSLSIERLFVPPFLSSPRSVRISSFIETQQVELGWFSKKLAEFIKPAHPVFIARPNLLAPNLDHSVFFFWEKILLEAVPCCGNVDRFFARRRDSSSLFLFLKTTIITNLIANRWIERLVRIIDPPLSLVSSFLLCSYARRVLSMALYFFLFPSFSSMSFFYEGYFKVHDRGWGIRNLPELSSSVFKGGKGNACTHIHARWWSSRFVDFVRNNDRTLADTASYIQTGAGSGLIVSGEKKRKERRKTNEIGS